MLAFIVFLLFVNMADDKPAWTDKPSWTVKPWVFPISDQLTMQVRTSFFCHTFSDLLRYINTICKIQIAVQDLIDTPLDEALAKLEARVTENKIALAVQAMESHKGRLALEQVFKAEAEWSRHKAEYVAKQLRDREEKLAERRAAKRARTQVYL